LFLVGPEDINRIHQNAFCHKAAAAKNFIFRRELFFLEMAKICSKIELDSLFWKNSHRKVSKSSYISLSFIVVLFETHQMVQFKKNVLNDMIEQSWEIQIEVYGEYVEILHRKVSQTKYQGVALDQDEHFDLICTLVKVFIFMFKNAIV
jgi:hypothetical protein